MTTLMTEDEIVEAMVHAYYNAMGGGDTPNAFAMRAALRIAIPWAREQALREAAEIVAEAPTEEVIAAIRMKRSISAKILALIPSRPSQGPTDE